jgi:hypothetical protein
MKTEEGGKMSEVKECPECGGELEKGYVIVDGLRWSREKHEYFALMTELVVYSPFILANLEGYRCQKCKLIEFHYKNAVTETPPSFLKKCAKCNENIPVASEYCPRCGAEQRKKKGVKS